MDGVETQRGAMAKVYGEGTDARWAMHSSTDPFTRFLRDRRLSRALQLLRQHGRLEPARQRVLVVCGGVGGEGLFLRRAGFRDVTVSDLSAEAMERCRSLAPDVATRQLNAEDMTEVADGEYDLVLVQDGLHHLPRPTLGFTEMLRVAREAAIVIEPHYGLVGRALGTEWEVQDEAVNYVFRWDRPLLEQLTRSYLLSREAEVIVQRLWDHSLALGRACGGLPAPMRLPAAKLAYGALAGVGRGGNMMIGVVLKDARPKSTRIVSH